MFRWEIMPLVQSLEKNRLRDKEGQRSCKDIRAGLKLKRFQFLCHTEVLSVVENKKRAEAVAAPARENT